MASNGVQTIIECLKYITTGALPPGARSGQSFIHDPKVRNLKKSKSDGHGFGLNYFHSCLLQMAGKSEVKAQIKLRFTNRVPQTMVCVRNFQVSESQAGEMILTFRD